MNGRALENARKRAGVSQVEAARRLGLSQPMLSHMESGRRNVRGDVARRAVELFGADPTALPVSCVERHSEEDLAAELGALKYRFRDPGFSGFLLPASPLPRVSSSQSCSANPRTPTDEGSQRPVSEGRANQLQPLRWILLIFIGVRPALNMPKGSRHRAR